MKKLQIMNDVLDAAERRELSDSDYGLPERREYPMIRLRT